MLKRWCTGALVLTLSATLPAAAAEPDASTRAAARNIATAGVLALERGDVELATQKLTKAYELLPVPSIALWLARALVKRGQLVEAAEHYIQAGRLSPSLGSERAVQEQAQRDAAQELTELTPRIPKLLITLEGARAEEVTLSVDGKPLAAAMLGEEQPMNPGAHTIRGTRRGEAVEQPITLLEGQSRSLALQFRNRAAAATATTPTPLGPGALPVAPPPSAAPDPSHATHASSSGNKTFAYVAFAVGGAALATGGVTGVLAITKRSDLDDNPACQDGVCSSSIQDDVDSFRAMRTVSTIGFVAGGLCAGAGLVLWLTSGSGQQNTKDSSRVGLRVAPNAVSMTGSF
jgi:hypothetical protein